MTSIKLSKQELFQLFLIGALPIHFWSIFLVLRDFSWLIEQTSLGFAIGYLSYSLLVALIESVLFFIAMFVLGLLLPKQWDTKKTVATLSMIAVIIGLWGIVNQTYFLLLENPPAFFTWIRPRLFNRQELGLSLLVFAVLASISLPIYFIQKSDPFKNTVLSIVANLIILSGFYIILDIFGIVIILLRNINI